MLVHGEVPSILRLLFNPDTILHQFGIGEENANSQVVQIIVKCDQQHDGQGGAV